MPAPLSEAPGYDDDDLSAAVSAGVVPASIATDFRAFVAARRDGAAADEEYVRLLTGFNDIFVTIAAVLTLLAVGVLANLANPMLAGIAVAAVAWLLAEQFTRRRRMALPSIVLLIVFVGAAGVSALAPFPSWSPTGLQPRPDTWRLAPVVAMGTACVAALLHWWRFHVPITIAALTTTGLATIAITGAVFIPALADYFLEIILGAGLILFALALWWDASDVLRRTRRSDIAFWLHLAAAPLIVHPLFAMIGLIGSDSVSVDRAVMAIGVYLALALIALVIDRRAVLVSALAYVLYATSSLLKASGNVSTALASTGLIIGSALLVLSIWWAPLRRPFVRMLPVWARRLVPNTDPHKAIAR